MSLAITLVSAASAQPFTCKTDLDGMHSGGDYRFSYESWVWEDGEYHKLCHCVRNESNRELYVEWEGADVNGFVRPGQTNHAVFSYESPRFAVQNQSLWYGGQPSEILAPTYYYDYTVATDPDRPVANHINDRPEVSVEARTSVPMSELSSFSDRQEMIDFVGEYPGYLDDFYMVFTSLIEDRAAGTISFECQYEILGRSWSSEYSLSFDSDELNEIMFGGESLIIVSGAVQNEFESNVEIRPLSSGFAIRVSNTFDVDEGQEFATHSARLQIESLSGFVAASLPVQYYWPD